MSERVIVFIILIAVQVIYSKAQEGTTKIPTFEKIHELATQTPSDSAQENIAPEISNIENMLEYTMQKLCESKYFAVPYSIGIRRIIELFRCAIQGCNNVRECTVDFPTLQNMLECAMQKTSERTEDCVNEIKGILICTVQKPSESVRECTVDFPTLQNMLECAMQKASERTQGSIEEVPTIEDMTECAGQIPSENEYIFRKQNYNNDGIKNREEL